MKCLIVPAIALLSTASAFAQQAETQDLTVTTATGKVLTFQTAEQKERYLARVSQLHVPNISPSGSAAAPDTTPAAALSMGHTALDAKPTGTGKVNVGAPTFTANYYMLEPETWVGKQLTLSVAYILPSNDQMRADGMRRLYAHTWGRTQAAGDQSPGGTMTILATPEAARRIASLCGSSIQYNQTGMKLSLIKGELTVLDQMDKGMRRYGLIVTQ